MTLLLNSATAYPLLGINKEKDKATYPSPLSRGNVSVTCQLLMRPNERISPLLQSQSQGPIRHLYTGGPSKHTNWLLAVFTVRKEQISCERGGITRYKCAINYKYAV